MATLADGERRALWTDIMRQWSVEREPVAVDKLELYNAIETLDQWLEDHPEVNGASDHDASLWQHAQAIDRLLPAKAVGRVLDDEEQARPPIRQRLHHAHRARLVRAILEARAVRDGGDLRFERDGALDAREG